MHEVEHAAVLLDAARLAAQHHGHCDLNLAIHVDAIEIRVQRMIRDRIELQRSGYLLFADFLRRVQGGWRLSGGGWACSFVLTLSVGCARVASGVKDLSF